MVGGTGARVGWTLGLKVPSSLQRCWWSGVERNPLLAQPSNPGPCRRVGTQTTLVPRVAPNRLLATITNPPPPSMWPSDWLLLNARRLQSPNRRRRWGKPASFAGRCGQRFLPLTALGLANGFRRCQSPLHASEDAAGGGY